MSYKRGQTVFVPNGQNVIKVKVTRVYRGKPYAVLPGDKKSTALNTESVYTEEISALKFMDKFLVSGSKELKTRVKVAEKKMKAEQKLHNVTVKSHGKIRARIAKIKI